MIQKRIKNIFKKGSITYYWSSLLFPKSVREDVFNLYAFVRIADNFVDNPNQKKIGFNAFRKKFDKAYFSNTKTNDMVIDNFILLAKSKSFEKKWIDAFLDSMKSDFNGNTCKNYDEILKYMYGSAEVIGLMMAQIMNLSSKSHEAAKLLGRAYQYVNIIRDISIDNSLKRTYIPVSEINKYGLNNLNRPTSSIEKEKFCKMLRGQITLFEKWMRKAESGYKFIPPRLLIPIITASDMYKWTAKVIYENPLIVFEKEVKPTPIQVILHLGKNILCQIPYFGFWCINQNYKSIKHGSV